MRPTPRMTFRAAVAFYTVWRHLPPAQRRQVLRLAARYGPRVAALAVALARQRRASAR